MSSERPPNWRELVPFALTMVGVFLGFTAGFAVGAFGVCPG